MPLWRSSLFACATACPPGAYQISPDLLKGRTMLNLDTEDWGEVFIGCAGGGDTTLVLEVAVEAAPPGMTAQSVRRRALRMDAPPRVAAVAQPQDRLMCQLMLCRRAPPPSPASLPVPPLRCACAGAAVGPAGRPQRAQHPRGARQCGAANGARAGHAGSGPGPGAGSEGQLTWLLPNH
jgi:hypothetical protein